MKIASNYEISNAIIATDEAMASFIDYIAGLLMSKIYETLQDIIEWIFNTSLKENTNNNGCKFPFYMSLSTEYLTYNAD